MFSVRAPVHYEPEIVLQEKRMIEKKALKLIKIIVSTLQAELQSSDKSK
jgi:hypothetical protein